MAPASRAKPRSAWPAAARTRSTRTAGSSTSSGTKNSWTGSRSWSAPRSKRAKKKRPPDVANKYQSVRGFNDVLPEDAAAWQFLHAAASQAFAAYGYGELRLPVLERTEL